MVGLVAAEHVIDEVGRDAQRPAALVLAGNGPLDQPADDRRLPKRPAQERRGRHPVRQFILQDLRAEQRRQPLRLLQRPARHHIVAGHEAERFQPRRLHAPCQQHAQRLVRIPPGKAIGHHVPAPVAREGLDQQVIQPRQHRTPRLHLQPLRHDRGHLRPARRRVQQPTHPCRQMRGQRHPPAHVAGNRRRPPPHLHADIGAVKAGHLQHLPGKQEAVAGAQLAGKPLLHLPQPPPPQPHIHRHRLDDGARIQSMLRGK